MRNRNSKLVARKVVKSLCALLSKFSVCSKTRAKSPVHFSLLFLFAILFSPVSAAVASDGSSQSNRLQLQEVSSSKSLAREIVFIDSAVEDQSLLIKAVRPDAEIVLLPSGADGVSQIAQSLRGRSEISAIHIVSHGHAGQLLLGKSDLNSNTLPSYLSEINTISAALSKNADILLYGCNVAQGDNGKAFISKLAEMTNADVAASENVTGDAEKGGDWVLENSQGEVQMGVVFSPEGLVDYKQLLATPVITTTPVISVDEDAGYSYTIFATDADLHTLTYSAPIKPTWLTFTPGTRELTGAPTNAEVGNHSVVLEVTDGIEPPVQQSFNVEVVNTNDIPGGGVTIDGGSTATEGVQLTANTSTITDEDGVGGFGYAWKRGTTTVGTAKDYTPVQADVGSTLKVIVSYVDGGGKTEILESSSTSPVINTNDIPGGGVTIDGGSTATEGVQLTANTSTITDEDGVGGFGYSWKRGTTTVGTAKDYTPVQADVGSTLAVTVSYVDGGGKTEIFTSPSTSPVIDINNIPGGGVTIDGGSTATEGVQLTANTSTITDDDGVGGFGYSWKRGTTTVGTAKDYTPVQADVGSTLAVTVSYVDGGGKTEIFTSPSTSPVINTNDSPTGQPVIIGEAIEGVELTVDISAIEDIDGLGEFSYQWLRNGVAILEGGTGTTYTLVQADVAAQISLVVSYTDGGGLLESVTSLPTVPVVNVNDSPTGQPVIIGEAIEGVELTVDISAIEDIDGLGEFSYQWLRTIGETTLEVGASATYTLVQADVAAQISLVVSYTDGGGLLESVTSLPTVPVVNVNDPPVGLPIIIGSPVQGGVLTVDTLSITDIDGLGEFSYQWLRDGLAIPDAIAPSYTLVQEDVNASISVVVSYTDGQLTPESVTSLPTASVANVNDPGVVIIDSIPVGGLAIDGELLSVISITDLDGTSSSNFDYQWLRDGVEISGETHDNYRIKTIDLRTLISLRVTYTDDFGEPEVVISNPVGPIFPDVPKVVPPDAVGPVVSTGWFTFVEIDQTGQATATDGFDGALIPFPDSNGQFRPGVTGVIWSAVDSADNVGTAVQEVKVVPLVDINKGQISAEGASVQVKVALNGNAINYPVTVPYTVSGTAAATDHTLVSSSVIINEPTDSGLPEGLINFAINKDSLAEGTETVVITLGTPSNAVLGLVKTHTVQIVEGNVAPMVSLSASQSGIGTMLKVDPNGNEVVVSAVATDVNGDSLVYDWSGTDTSIADMDIDTDETTFTFNPGDVTPGFYNFNVSVSDDSSSVSATLTLEVLEQTPTITTKDSDGDGIVDHLDAISASHILQQKQSISNAFLIQTEPGLKLSLGETAFKANNSQSMVTSQDVVDFAFSGVTGIELLDEIENIGGYFDFIVSGLPIAGQSVQVVLPQLAPLPKIPVYRKLTLSGWKDFVKDEKNTIASAAGSEGYCPPPGDAAYQPGLSEGRWCVLLTIEDGGPNDLDGVVNNSVTDPGGVSRFLTSVSVKSSGGGGGSANPLLLLSVFFMLLYYRHGKHLMRKAA